MRYLLLLTLLTACGYQLGERATLQQYRTISVPYVKCDDDGRFTEALVRAISRSHAFQYCDCGGQLILEASITSRGRENIGYEFDETAQKKRLLADEGRMIYVVEISVIDARRCCTVLGPFCVKAYVDYPFDPQSVNTDVSVFSLGQFVAIDAAEEAACRPLYEDLARKVVDYLASAW